MDTYWVNNKKFPSKQWHHDDFYLSLSQKIAMVLKWATEMSQSIDILQN